PRATVLPPFPPSAKGLAEAWMGTTDAVAVIVNRAAGGSGDRAARDLHARLAEHDVRAELQVVPADSVTGAVREAAGRYLVVAVAGGDGTLSAAAEVLSGTETVLAALPFG